MSFDFMYNCVMDSTWIFLSGWMLVLIGTGIRMFRTDVVRPRQK